MINIKIEKNVPLPQTKESEYKLTEMQIGDSIVIPMEYAPDIRSTISAINRYGTKKFVTRSINQKQLRIWRKK